jgi:hypothetical protein
MNYDIFSLINQVKDNVPYPWFYYSVIEKEERYLRPKIKIVFRINNAFSASVQMQGDVCCPALVERHDFAFLYAPINPDMLSNCTGLGEILRWLLETSLTLEDDKQLESILNNHHTTFFPKTILSSLNVCPCNDLKRGKPYSDSKIEKLMGEKFRPSFMGPFNKIEFYEPFKGTRREPTFYFHVPWSNRRLAVGASSGSVYFC